MSPPIQIKCRHRRSPRSIDPTFDNCTECIVTLSTDDNAAFLQISRLLRPLFPPLVSRQRTFSVVDAIGINDHQQPTMMEGEMEMDVEGEKEKRGSPPRTLSAPNVGEGRVRETEGLPPTNPLHSKRDNSPLIRQYSNISRTPSQTRSEMTHSRSRSQSRSRSRSRSVRGTPLRKRSIGAHAAFQVGNDSSEKIMDGNSISSRSLTPLRQRGYSVEEETVVEPLNLPLTNVLSVDQEIPCRKRQSSMGSDFFSSIASEGSSSCAATSPPPSDSYHGKPPHRIFLHTSSNGYIEFSFDNPNSHDVLMAFLSAHLKPDQLPRKTPNSNKILPPLVHGALQTMVLTPTKTMENRTPSILRPPLSRSTSTDSACTLDKLQKKMIQQRIQQESTPLEKMKENLANWMSSIVDCACCQDTTTVAPEPEEKKKGIVESPASKLLKRKGIGGLSFEESSARLSPRLSFEKSVATDSSSRR